MEEPPLGWTQRHKRSHDELEHAAAPAWSFSHRDNDYSGAREPTVPFRRTPGWHDLNYDFGSQRAFDPTPRFSSRSYFEPIDFGIGAPASASALEGNVGVQDMASTAPQRFEGDGYDYRRPVTAAGEQSVAVDLTGEDDEDEDEEGEEDELDEVDLDMDLEFDEENDFDFEEEEVGEQDVEEQDVIDLTADDSGYGASQDEDPASQDNGGDRATNRPRRLPRGMDIIIDLDNGHEEWTVGTPQQEPGSPDIEFISSRPINPAQNHRTFDGDEVEFVRANPLPQEELWRRRNQELDNVIDLLGTMNGRFNHLRAQVDRFNAQVNRTADRFRRTPVALPRNAARVRVGAFMAPDLNFDMVGFDLGMGGRAEPPPPTYEAPEKAPEGFTRSPQEDDVLVCPNCEDELCCGQDDVKKQVWVVKNCGHVYCGECTANRSSKRSAKGKERPVTTKPFKECQVVGCGKSVTNRKAMVQIFM